MHRQLAQLEVMDRELEPSGAARRLARSLVAAIQLGGRGLTLMQHDGDPNARHSSMPMTSIDWSNCSGKRSRLGPEADVE